MEQDAPPGKLQELWRRAVAGQASQNPLLVAYGEQLLRQGPPKFFGRLDEAALYAFIEGRFRFAVERPGGPFALRMGEGPSLDGAGGGTPLALVEIIVDDRPFLIDSIQSYLVSRGTRIQAIFHPILHVERDADGRMVAVRDFRGDAANESHISFMIDSLPVALRQPLLEELRSILRDVIRCVDDFPAILERVQALRGQAGSDGGAPEVERIVEWFQQDNFVFMGYLPYRRGDEGPGLSPVPEQGLGLFHPESEMPAHREALRNEVTRFLNKRAGENPFFLMEETSTVSRMRRRALLSALLLSPRPRDNGGQAAVVVGIFSDRSLRADVMEIPVVADKLRAVVARHEIAPRSYKQREVLTFFTGLPRFELFRLSAAALDAMVGLYLSVVDQPRTEVALLSDPETDSLRIVLTVPGMEFAHDKLLHLRQRVEALLNFGAQNAYVVTGRTFCVVNIVFYHVSAHKERLPAPERLERAILEELQTREDRLARSWLETAGVAASEHMARYLVQALPDSYKVAHADAEIVADLSLMERLIREKRPQFVLRDGARDDGVKMALFAWEKLSLSRMMPILDHLRLLVVEEEIYAIELPEAPAYLHTFLLQPPAAYPLEPGRHQGPLEALIFRILDGRLENDPLSALLLACDFDWRKINLMRLYRNYLMQVGSVYTRRTIEETLIRRTRATRALFAVFDARHRPGLEGREAARRKAEAEMAEAEREIDNLTEDRIFKAILNLIDATVRTNFYQEPESPLMAVKLASRAIEQLPAPRPLYETAVYGPLMEGIHLRGDKIARGGIRYSDRPDDFRTEVLGLMATQMKKNALIVPLGSKGGFVVKSLAPYGGDARKAGDAQYEAFMRQLLSLSDNLAQGRVVPPARVVRYDDDDPYLVVAADKGTAHLSDTANRVAQEVGFWLGDAFASGGSHGYDHKQVGITARGAWESVQRHFREHGVDVQRQPVTVVGIGDMSGDVFGNGVLLSRTLLLVGAFDHRHIFLDPDPDPEAAYRERERLFRLSRSSWQDYDATLISEGGGVFPRGAKAIPLNAQLQALLGTERTSLSGEEVIRALLSAKVDLLWNGGIGTYIKAFSETHANVGDPNNDAVRIDAPACRARVVGEGGNLGLTQLARIEFDLQGGCINTDAIDNAGGVNLSDHEVNLKILLGGLVEQGLIAGLPERNAVLAEQEQAVAYSVLHANFLQVLTLSMDRIRSRQNVGPFIALVDLLAAQGGMDRRTEAIPNAARFQQFQTDGAGVPRPVLSVLLAYAKMLLYKRLAASDLVSEPFLQRFFVAYFPPVLAERFDLAAAPHALRKEIIATVVTNRVIDQAGMTFVADTAAFTGQPWPEVVRAYLLADDVVGAAALRERLHALSDDLPAEQQYALLMALEDLLAGMVRWLLLHRAPAERGFAALPVLRRGWEAYVAELPGLLDDDDREALAGQTEELVRLGLGEESARQAARLPYLGDCLMVASLVEEQGLPVRHAFELVALLDERLRFSALEEALGSVRLNDTWQRRYVDKLRHALALARRTKLGAILGARSEGQPPAAWLQAWQDARHEAWETYEQTVRQVLAQEPPELVALGLAIDLLEAL